MTHKVKQHYLKIFFFTGICIFFQNTAYALEAEFSGQVSGWTTETRRQGQWENTTGLRYIPQFTVSQALAEESFIDAEVSINSFLLTRKNSDHKSYDAELYRALLRYATAQTETRVGLQKINFGPAQLLRSLMWFDRMDPTDPTQFTEGVYAARFKYNTLNNASFWLWCLYGNKDPKGYEWLPTIPEKPEYGGRIQYPVLGGELAATVHTRKADGDEFFLKDYTENRYALDGQWDIGIGVWFESVLIEQKFESIYPQIDPSALPYGWTKMITIGADYTIGMGNGLYILAEHMATVVSEKPFGWNSDQHVSAVMFRYPVGILDSFFAIGYYAWETQAYGQYINWQRTYDKWVLSLGLFYYPETAEGNAGFIQNAGMGGYGAQFMIIFNH
ncbi:MAG: hypothetical protein JRJ39_11180 [Deltaproteobacteria bacterium]|nr:hypothetical protein [Deltaproteobacteria bacterium]MBW1814198.1 hypothetical protein [Deltaproteobacteria bacterium]MBW1848520.1 hypothetical protein [Deltaproteobacteria bacterium]MBW2365235.1 hypothetical protein [Deltaproteobacteria bacterium]